MEQLLTFAWSFGGPKSIGWQWMEWMFRAFGFVRNPANDMPCFWWRFKEIVIRRMLTLPASPWAKANSLAYVCTSRTINYYLFLSFFPSIYPHHCPIIMSIPFNLHKIDINWKGELYNNSKLTFNWSQFIWFMDIYTFSLIIMRRCMPLSH